ncbi:hypothetical protein U3653_20275 [Nocardia sp. CDC186]|uniref:Uncharacterized protein n=1 Tax=Nocardia implantans TaxID=3108168 RepID=A0ABU6AY07_9NOCA|nr:MULTISPECIES: hypothetical protein [unclassified Nocardia]MBF6190563.1 hypothetical protein [Nocardia beijingensis]MEA3528476.1 hypothetical protein [Nocardia sp. CDC192]MEB3512372.1 hypothetical protein [Nocardia sp. CDC186]
MSDHSVEDEIFAQARQFSAAMRTAMQRHAQAANWLERRRARKEISCLVRTERRQQQQARAHHRIWTSQAVDRYRLHAQAVAQRAIDPRVDHDRRARDARALAEHRDRLAVQFIGNEHLTRTEQGIALDGLDAATVFPEYKTGNLFARAHKVKGLEALHYRARVAREKVTIDRYADRERLEWQQGLDAAHRANAEEALLARIDAAQAHRHRYTAQMTWTDPDGGTLTESRSFATEHTATEWLQRNIGRTSWSDGTTLAVETRDTLNAAKQYIDHGRPETVADQLAAREAVLRERTLAGQVHREQDTTQVREAEQGQQAERFSSTVTYLPQNANQVVHERGAHATEADSARWTAQQLAGIRPAPGTTVHVAAFDLADEWRPERVFRAEGGRSMVTDEVSQWREGIDRGSSAQERGEQQLPAPVQQVAAERDQLAEDLAQRGREIEQLSGDLVDAANLNNQLRNRHRLSIEHNNELTEAKARLTRQLTAVTAERDQLRGERDEAVAKLAERTPAHERYGSPERQAEQAGAEAAAANGNTTGRVPIKGHAFAGLVNGRNRDREMEMEL